MGTATNRQIPDIAHELALAHVTLPPADLERIAARLRSLRDPARQMTLVHDYLALAPVRERPKILAALLRDARPSAREAALDSATEVGPSALPALAELADIGDAVQRWHAYVAIRSIGTARALPLLVRGLEDDESGIRWVASHGLEQMGPDAFLPVVRAVTRRPATIVFHRAARRVLIRTRPVEPQDEIDGLLESLNHFTTTAESQLLAAAVLNRLSTS